MALPVCAEAHEPNSNCVLQLPCAGAYERPDGLHFSGVVAVDVGLQFRPLIEGRLDVSCAAVKLAAYVGHRTRRQLQSMAALLLQRARQAAQ